MSDQPPSTDSPPSTEPRLAAAAAELTAVELRGIAPLVPAELARASATEPALEVLGQQRALDAIRLAIGIDAPGYNVYVTGLRTNQERQSILRLLREKAASMPTPGDWVYVHNFRNTESPVSISLDPGQGRELRDRMVELVNFVREQLPKAFREQDFDQERSALKEKYNKRAQELFGGFESRARARGFAIQGTGGGQLIFIPLVGGKVPESPEVLNREMAQMSEEQRQVLAKAQGELQDELGGLLQKQQDLMRELMNEIRQIERAFAGRLISPSIASIAQHFSNPAVTNYLSDVAEHMLGHLERFREPAGPPEGREATLPGLPGAAAPDVEYEVNLLVDNADRTGAPVIDEDSPTHRGLFGTIERWVDPMGRLGTNFTRIVSGSFIRAHGGFLVLDLEEAMVEPGVWKTLKRSLKTGRMTPESFEPFPFLSVTGLKPEPIAIRNKLVVLGGPMLYNLLYFYDQDFSELFKIKAEMVPVIDANPGAVQHYAAHVAALARRESLPAFDGSALARLIEFAMREAGDRGRVLTRMEPVDDLARESAYFAHAESAGEVTAGHVERALSERVLRRNFIEEEIRRLIAQGTLVVHLEGSRIGQINGLAVMDVGGYAFGRPSRVTATVALGQAGVINIERESRLSGATHDKGIMILSGFLRWRFGQEHPIAMAASICFEQSYSGIDGDSASSTELYALLSALSGLPIRQNLAVTGSVDQYGNVQAIGAANEKIESFYRVCKALGLSGAQGVLIPRANVRNLILDAEVIAAVERGQFHIYPIEHIDQGIALLTGVVAGTADEPGTVNHLVDQRLRKMADLMRGEGSRETRVIQEPAQPPSQPKPPEPPEPQR